jgi:hypothetical protein
MSLIASCVDSAPPISFPVSTLSRPPVTADGREGAPRRCDETTQRPRHELLDSVPCFICFHRGMALDEPTSSSASGGTGRGFRERMNPSPTQVLGDEDEASRDGSQEPLAPAPPPPTPRGRFNGRRLLKKRRRERVRRRGKPSDLVAEGR